MSATMPKRSPGGDAPPRILLAEDDAMFALPLAKILERSGYRVIRVDNGVEALDRMGEADCLLLDIGLPGRDGMELAGLAAERFPGVPVILMSGRYSAQEVSGAEREGILGFLPKPFQTEVLLGLLDRIRP